MFEISTGDLIDSVKNAAEGVKNHSSNVAAWMKNNVSPALRNMLTTSPGLPLGEPHPRPSTSSAIWTGRLVWCRFMGVPVKTVGTRESYLTCMCSDLDP